MRRKIAKRLRRECMRDGIQITKEAFIREPGWKRKDCGYEINFVYRGWKVWCCGHDILQAWRDAKWTITNWDLGDWEPKDETRLSDSSTNLYFQV